jgi:hypothetical protein
MSNASWAPTNSGSQRDTRSSPSLSRDWARRPSGRLAELRSDRRRRGSEPGAKDQREVAVARKAERVRDPTEIGIGRFESFQCQPQPEVEKVVMQGHAGGLPKNSAQMKGRGPHASGQLRQARGPDRIPRDLGPRPFDKIASGPARGARASITPFAAPTCCEQNGPDQVHHLSFHRRRRDRARP